MSKSFYSSFQYEISFFNTRFHVTMWHTCAMCHEYPPLIIVRELSLFFRARTRRSTNLIASWPISLNNYHKFGIFLPVLSLSTIDLEHSIGLEPWRGVRSYDNLL